MGREIRAVPPNWQHPQHEGWHDGRLQPMYDETFEVAAARWKAGLAKWEAGELPSYCADEGRGLEFWEYEGSPPDRAYYRPWRDEDATWVQLWETVSEGTPVSPPFATLDELQAYLAEHGDFWDQKRGHGGWGADRARAFVANGRAPSLMIVQSAQGAVILDSKDIPLNQSGA